MPIANGAWTAGVPLPGGDIAHAKFEPFAAKFANEHPWLPAELARRYARAYGTRARALIGAAKALPELGREFAPGLFEQELRYLRDVEWARCAQDVLWRRSKLGLHLAPGTGEHVTQAIDAWFAHAPASDTQRAPSALTG
jgi:glycerol-3-phosphate dehydrogenase